MKCFFRLLLLASVPARAPIRGKAGAFAALLLNISPLFTLSLGSAAGFRSRRRAQIATVARQPARRRFPAMLGPL
jgi:hypothetical protein